MLAPRRLEKIVKGFANHHRIEMLNLLERKPKLSLMAIAQDLRLDFRTASEHLRRLALAELIEKRYKGSVVEHSLSDSGRNILRFLRKLE